MTEPTTPTSRHAAARWQSTVAVALALAGITALCWVFVVSPMLSQSSQSAVARDELERVRIQSAQSARSLAAAQTAVAHTRKTFDSYNQPCWTETDRSRRLEWLYSVSQAAGLKIESAEPGEVETISNRKAVAMRLSARGSYAAVIAAVHDLRIAMPDVLLSGMSLTALPGAEVAEVNVLLDLVWIPVSPSTEPASKSSKTSEASILTTSDR